jgi:hypothetical protein
MQSLVIPDLLELNRPLEKATDALMWMAATNAKEVKFQVLGSNFTGNKHPHEDSDNFNVHCHDKGVVADKLYNIRFMVPVSHVKLYAIRHEGQVPKDTVPDKQLFWKTVHESDVITEIDFKLPFPLYGFRLQLDYSFDSLKESCRFDFDYLEQQKILRPAYTVGLLSVADRDILIEKLTVLRHVKVDFVVSFKNKSPIEYEGSLDV